MAGFEYGLELYDDQMRQKPNMHGSLLDPCDTYGEGKVADENQRANRKSLSTVLQNTALTVNSSSESAKHPIFLAICI